MKTSTKVIIGILTALLVTVIGISVYMAHQSTGSNFDPILDGNLANAATPTPTPEAKPSESPEATVKPTPTPDSTSDIAETTIEVSQTSISGTAGKAGFLGVTIKPEKYNADYKVYSEDDGILTVSKSEGGIDYRLEGEGKTTVTIEVANGKKRTITAIVSPAPTPVPTSQGSTYSTRTPVPTVAPTPTQVPVSTPVPTAVPTVTPVPTANPENPAWSEGDLNQYDPHVDAGNVNACEYIYNGQVYTDVESNIPAGADIQSCWPQ